MKSTSFVVLALPIKNWVLINTDRDSKIIILLAIVLQVPMADDFYHLQNIRTL